MKQISYEEMAEKLWAAKESVARFKFPYRFDFWCNYDAETDEKEWAYHAEVSMFADAPVVIINYYGGVAGFIYDIAEEEIRAALLDASRTTSSIRDWRRAFG